MQCVSEVFKTFISITRKEAFEDIETQSGQMNQKIKIKKGGG